MNEIKPKMLVKPEMPVKPKILGIDLETYSSAPLPKCGVYRYADAPDFEILLFSYAYDDGPVMTIDLACGEQLPEDVLMALKDPAVIKVAYNAQFERAVRKALEAWPLPEHEWELYALDQIINDRGVRIDRKLVKNGSSRKVGGL